MILNLTQHPATPEQTAVGVVDLPQAERKTLVNLLTFDSLPSAVDVANRATALAILAATAFEDHPVQAMIGGAPYLMAPLEDALVDQGIQPVYAFSMRESVEEVQQDGSVRKVNIFRHAGFVQALDVWETK